MTLRPGAGKIGPEMTDWKATPLAPFVATSQDAPGFWMQGCL